MSFQKLAPGIYAGKHTVAVFSKDERTSVVKSEQDKDTDYVKWGDDNLYPQKFLEQFRKNGAANGAFKLLKATHFGEGITLYKENIENGKKNHHLVSVDDHEDIKSFFKKNKLPRFFIETITDLEMWSFGMPEFVVSNNYEKITRVKRQRSAWCRFKQMNNEGLIETVFLKSDWQDDSIDKDTTKISLVDPYWSVDEVKSFLKKKKIKNFILPIYYPMIDEVYYPKTDWHSSYINGWFKVSNSVAILKEFIFENQLHIKYIIYVSDKYFTAYYGADWEEYPLNKKEEIRKALMKAIDDHLKGNEAGGRSLTSPIFLDDRGNWVKGIEVTPINNQMKDGAYLPDASAANSEILFSMGVDPTLIGAGIPGGKLGAGSGSDKREAFTILSSLFKTKRETTSEIWSFIRDYNGWDDSLKLAFPNTVLTTLDKNPTGKETKI